MTQSLPPFDVKNSRYDLFIKASMDENHPTSKSLHFINPLAGNGFNILWFWNYIPSMVIFNANTSSSITFLHVVLTTFSSIAMVLPLFILQY